MKNLKAEMARRNLTSKDLALLIKMPAQTLRGKINGNTAFTIPEAYKIIQILKKLSIKQSEKDELTIEYLFEPGEQSA